MEDEQIEPDSLPLVLRPGLSREHWEDVLLEFITRIFPSLAVAIIITSRKPLGRNRIVGFAFGLHNCPSGPMFTPPSGYFSDDEAG